MTNQNEYLKSTKLITAHYGEEYEHYYNAIVPPVSRLGNDGPRFWELSAKCWQSVSI